MSLLSHNMKTGDIELYSSTNGSLVLKTKIEDLKLANLLINTVRKAEDIAFRSGIDMAKQHLDLL